MDRVELETTLTPTIKIDHVAGNLRLKGWDRPSLRADCDSENAHKIEQTEDTFTVSSTTGCMLRIPMESTLIIGRIDGDLMLKSTEALISVEKVNGQIMAKSIGSMELNTVAGSINARGIEGNFVCKTANGNVNLQDVEGKVKIDQATGNLTVKGDCGGISAQVAGSATLKMETFTECSYQINAGGNIYCRPMPEVNATFTLKSGSENIKVQQENGVEVFKTAEHEIVIGDGTTKIVLKAGANIDLILPGENEFDWEFELNLKEDLTAMAEDISQVVTDQIETQLDVLGDHLNSLSDNLSSIDPEISKKTRVRIEAKRAKLERKLAKAERRAAEKARRSSRKITRRYSINTPKSDPVSDDERQKVLEMLQNKLISVEDAEALLAALEGKS